MKNLDLLRKALLVSTALTLYGVTSSCNHSTDSGDVANSSAGTTPGASSTSTPAPPAASVVAPLAVLPLNTTLLPNATATFIASGGSSPYIYSVLSGLGSIDAATGLFTAPATSGQSVIQIMDNNGQKTFGYATVSANALSLIPVVTTLTPGMTETLTATGGTAPYTYSILSGDSTIFGNVLTASLSSGTAVVQVTDSSGLNANATLTIQGAGTCATSSVPISANFANTCSNGNYISGTYDSGKGSYFMTENTDRSVTLITYDQNVQDRNVCALSFTYGLIYNGWNDFASSWTAYTGGAGYPSLSAQSNACAVSSTSFSPTQNQIYENTPSNCYNGYQGSSEDYLNWWDYSYSASDVTVGNYTYSMIKVMRYLKAGDTLNLSKIFHYTNWCSHAGKRTGGINGYDFDDTAGIVGGRTLTIN